MSKSESRAYLVPAREHEVTLEIKRSKFIAIIGRCITTQDAHAFVETIRQREPSATHHCWAFVAGPPGSDMAIGYSDDGEPSGTAGRPMLSVLQYADVGEVVAVVTRYYGGQKLGTGGLVRAYSQAVSLALDTLPTLLWMKRQRVCMTLAYEDYETVKRMTNHPDILDVHTTFDASVHVTLDIPVDLWPQIQSQVRNATAGRAQWEQLDNETELHYIQE